MILEPFGGGGLLYCVIYPESTIPTARIPVSEIKARVYRAEGFAQFYTPDRRALTYGTYANGRREETWISVTRYGAMTEEFDWYREPQSISSRGRNGTLPPERRANYRSGDHCPAHHLPQGVCQGQGCGVENRGRRICRK